MLTAQAGTGISQSSGQPACLAEPLACHTADGACDGGVRRERFQLAFEAGFSSFSTLSLSALSRFARIEEATALPP